MASRYWVGGTASWNGTAGSKWSTTSGGAGGSAEPTNADDVFFDGASGTVTVTVATSTRVCKSLNFTGFTGTFAGSIEVDIGTSSTGNIVLGSGMTWTHTGVLSMVSSTGTNTITSNGITTSSAWHFDGTGGTWQLADAFVSTAKCGIGSTDTLDLNGKAMTCSLFYFSGAGTLTMGASTMTLTGFDDGANNVMDVVNTSVINSNTSTIVMSNTSSSTKTFEGFGKTFYDLSITGGGSGLVKINHSNTFHNLTINPPKSVQFSAGTTQTVTAISVAGTSGNVITITSSSAGSAATISQASGTVSGTYLSLQDSTATGGATFNAANSTNVSGNTGWNFLDPTRMFLIFE